ncbi:hypothetical protein [Rhodocytophaga aerolata]|uniref:hypothetical protein n=1 Tax=Rhodocytophaga aerolata TaxID=455078 RepID=UPI00366F923A
MSWINGNCQGDRNYECYYQSFNPIGYDQYGFPVYQNWCRDSDNPCSDFEAGGGLVKVVDHTRPDEGGGW